MADVMMMLGPYQFGLDTAAFQEINRNTEWRWPAQDVFESRPVLQFTGWGEDTLSLPGVVFPEYWGGTTQLDDLRALGDTGEPLILIDGRGNVLGQWVITGVSERGSVFAQAGVARRQEFTVNLKRYHDDGDIVGIPTPPNVYAVTTSAERATSVVAGAQSMAEQMTSALVSAAASVNALVSTVVTPLQSTLNAIGQATSMARELSRSATDAQSTMAALGGITNLSTAQSALGDLMRSASNASRVAAGASLTINGTVSAMQSAGESAAAINTVKSALIDVNRMAVSASGIRTQSEDIVRNYS